MLESLIPSPCECVNYNLKISLNFLNIIIKIVNSYFTMLLDCNSQNIQAVLEQSLIQHVSFPLCFLRYTLFFQRKNKRLILPCLFSCRVHTNTVNTNIILPKGYESLLLQKRKKPQVLAATRIVRNTGLEK